MKFIYTSLLLMLSISASAETITGTMPCGETKEVTKYLIEQFEEMPIIIGKADDVANSIMTLWINPLSKTWTIVATKNDITCIIGTGKDFTILAKRGNII